MTKTDLPPVHPGEIHLEDFLKPYNITCYRLANSIPVPQCRIDEICAGKRALSAVSIHPNQGQKPKPVTLPAFCSW